MDCEGMDRTYILEDLMGSVLRAAKVLDGHSAPDDLLAFENARPAYEIGERL
jgi:predicted HAD superfamily phosphohydrolase